MRFIVIDKREPFISDIQTRMIVDERDIELVGVATSANGINTLITETTPDVLVVSDTVFNEQEDWIYPNCKTVGYITTKNAPNVFKNVGIPAYEYVPTSETLLNLLSLGVPNAEKSEPTPISTPTPTPIPSMPIANNIEEDEDDDLPDFSKISAPQVVVEPQKETLVVPITNEPTQVAPQQEVKTVKETINQNTIAKNNLLARSLVQADIETKKKATQKVIIKGEITLFQSQPINHLFQHRNCTSLSICEFQSEPIGIFLLSFLSVRLRQFHFGSDQYLLCLF